MKCKSAPVSMDYQQVDCPTWMVNTDGYYATGVKNYLISDGIPEDGAETIIRNAAQVLSFCPNPTSNEEKKLTGIVIGKVQSGKTSNFIALTALAFDNGYSHIVVLGGTKKILVKQNSDRINEYFEKMEGIIVLNTSEHRSKLTEKDINQFIEMGNKVIIVALKIPSKIDFIRKNVFSGDVLNEKPTLIIDDEGDEASLNTLVKKGKKSTTYLAIEELKNVLKRHSFVSVTATPQANLLISSLDVLSPEFGVLVDPGHGYCGLDVFHNPASKYVIEIPDDEVSLLDEGVPKSFYSALATFFVACAIYEARGKKPSDKLSMLIHPSQKKVDHNIVFNKTEKIVNNWRNLSKNKNDVAYRTLKTYLQSAYNYYKDADISRMPSFEIVEEKALKAIKFCGLHIVNGDSVPNGADKFYHFNIYVGGAMLGRGLTLKGLAVTYIIRTAKGVSSVDTVQQRARWFGYKKSYLDLCRIFAVNKIIKEFKDIREHENDLWDTVRDANLNGIRFKDIARIFVLSDKLRMTRTSVAKTDNYTFKLWNIQRSFLRDASCCKSNINVLNHFRIEHEHELIQKRFGEGNPYVIAENVPFIDVKKDILDKFIFPANSKINKGVIDKLALLLFKKELNPPVDIIWMRDGSTSKHEVDSDGDISEYMVGRRPDDYKKPAIYKGDRYEFVKDNAMQIQIHMIENKNTGDKSPTIAFYIPNNCIEALTNLVIRA